MIRILGRVVLSLLVLPLPAAPAVPCAPALPDVGCVGCQGTGGGMSTASGGSCGGTVSISVTMQGGECKNVMTTEDGLFGCRATKPCKPTVIRSWSGLPAGSALEFCLTLDFQTLCLVNPPSAGSGTGSDTRDSATMSCDSDKSRTFTISSPSCGLSASSQVTCTTCEGF